MEEAAAAVGAVVAAGWHCLGAFGEGSASVAPMARCEKPKRVVTVLGGETCASPSPIDQLTSCVTCSGPRRRGLGPRRCAW